MFDSRGAYRSRRGNEFYFGAPCQCFHLCEWNPCLQSRCRFRALNNLSSEDCDGVGTGDEAPDESEGASEGGIEDAEPARDIGADEAAEVAARSATTGGTIEVGAPTEDEASSAGAGSSASRRSTERRMGGRRHSQQGD